MVHYTQHIIGDLVQQFMECPALWKALYNLSGSGQSAVSILFCEGGLLLLSQLPGSIQALLPHMAQSTSDICHRDQLTLHQRSQKPYGWGMNLTVHRWSLMCTNHIDMTAHTLCYVSPHIHSTPPIKKKYAEILLLIGSFSLRVMYLQVNGKYLVQRFSFVIADFSLKVTSLQTELSVMPEKEMSKQSILV